jgi:hypothetical protein
MCRNPISHSAVARSFSEPRTTQTVLGICLPIGSLGLFPAPTR